MKWPRRAVESERTFISKHFTTFNDLDHDQTILVVPYGESSTLKK